MAEMLLINPRRRKARRAATPKRRRVAAKRRRNPMPTVAAKRVRRMNPLAKRRTMARRRRNPIGAGRMGGAMLMAAIRSAFVGGAGSVAVDLLVGQLNKMNIIPATLRATPGKVGAGDAVKALITVAAGHFLSRPTRGLSRKMAEGALTVQAANIMKSFVPATMALGYFSPANVVQGNATVGNGLGAYTKGTPLLNAYMKPGPTALLSRAGSRQSAFSREGAYAFK